ncbi:MAG: OmpA family protein [Lachnospiraceae bacterium]|nr:OmpA family protein [Lachnospiraceae bacterium]
MNNKKKDRAAFAEPGYWQSYSDMMAALLLIFILIIAITLAIYKQKRTDLEEAQLQLNSTRTELEASQADLEASRADLEASEAELRNSLKELEQAYAQATMTKEELDAAYLEIDEARAELNATRSELQDIVGIRTDIIGELQTRFSNSSMKVDAQTGSITFSSDVLFRYNSATLTSESKETLKEIIPMYLGVLLQDNFRPYIAEIIIEGHTDTDGGYESNMTLSYNRANSVAKFCMDDANGLPEHQIGQLRDLLTVNGRSYSNPIYQENSTEVNMEASRRVEIKFRLKEDEMINKITEVLNQQ